MVFSTHAFDRTSGEELWGFVPPLIAPKLPTIINGSLNQQVKEEGLFLNFY